MPEKANTDTAAPEPQETEGQEQINGVLVRLVQPEEGAEVHLEVQALGEVKVTEIPVLLGLGRKVSEGQLGV